ncbi:hypothetical protein [Streptomyces mirabilis]
MALNKRDPARRPVRRDNGKFGNGWPGEQAWFAWLKTTVDRGVRGRRR